MNRITDLIAEDIEDILSRSINGRDIDYDVIVGMAPPPDPALPPAPVAVICLSLPSLLLGSSPLVFFVEMGLIHARNKVVLKENMDNIVEGMVAERSKQIAGQNGKS